MLVFSTKWFSKTLDKSSVNISSFSKTISPSIFVKGSELCKCHIIISEDSICSVFIGNLCFVQFDPSIRIVWSPQCFVTIPFSKLCRLGFDFWRLVFIRQCLLGYLQDRRIKVSLFMQEHTIRSSTQLILVYM